MMLTKTDFDQLGKLVRKVVREEVEAELKNTRDSFEHEIRTANLHLRNAMREQGDRIKNMEVRLLSVENEIKKARKDIRKLQKDVSVAIDFFNVEDTRLEKRVRKIEDHLSL